MKKRSSSRGNDTEVAVGLFSSDNDPNGMPGMSGDGGDGGLMGEKDGSVASPLLTGGGGDDSDRPGGEPTPSLSLTSQDEHLDEQPEGNASLLGCIVNQVRKKPGCSMGFKCSHEHSVA